MQCTVPAPECIRLQATAYSSAENAQPAAATVHKSCRHALGCECSALGCNCSALRCDCNTLFCRSSAVESRSALGSDCSALGRSAVVSKQKSILLTKVHMQLLRHCATASLPQRTRLPQQRTWRSMCNALRQRQSAFGSRQQLILLPENCTTGNRGSAQVLPPCTWL